MSTDLDDKLIFAGLRISGTVRRGQPDAITFQRSHGSLQIKHGVQAGANPKTQRQQLQRVHLKAATNNTNNISSADKERFRHEAIKRGKQRSGTCEFKSQFSKNNKYGQSKFSTGLYSGDLPERHNLRYGTSVFGEGFYSNSPDVPNDIDAMESQYPDISMDCFKPETE
ncbi:MAG: hypothetical protein U5R06_02280 [candidate division KSB1 bacterium]|nr:hypothetical protein [candidate division KSB1 bacterium]